VAAAVPGGAVETVETVEAFQTLRSNPASLGQLGRLQHCRGGIAKGRCEGTGRAERASCSQRLPLRSSGRSINQ
jgi:hypothetical protein